MTILANAKINYTLEVYGKRPDGYHALRSLVVPISLADTIDVELTSDGAIVSDTGFPDDLCVKAAKALRATCVATASSPSSSGADGEDAAFGYLRSVATQGRLAISQRGVKITVRKRIPVGGGLGGGSADAAAVLLALNELWKLEKSPEELAEIGAQVGSDVPALVLAQHYRRPVLMEGRGEKVSLVDSTIRRSDDSKIHLVLANPGVAVSTAEIYRLCTPRTEPAREPVNDLQTPAIRRHPEIARTLDALKDAGATDVRMSGSGATCFGFVRTAEEAERIRRRLAPEGFRCWTAETLNQQGKEDGK